MEQFALYIMLGHHIRFQWILSNLRHKPQKILSLSLILYFINYHIDSYRIKVTFYLLFNKNLALELVVSCKPQFFTVMIASATNIHILRCYFYSLKYITQFNAQDNPYSCFSQPIQELTVCYYHVTYKFQSESTLYSCLTVMELLAQSRHHI